MLLNTGQPHHGQQPCHSSFHVVALSALASSQSAVQPCHGQHSSKERERDQQKDSLSTTFFFSLPPQWHRSLVSAGGRGCLWLRGQNFARWHRWEWSGTAGWGTGDTRSPGQRNSSRQSTHVSLYDTPKPHQPINQQTNQSLYDTPKPHQPMNQQTNQSLYDTPKPHQPMNQQTNQSASLLQCCNQ